VNVDFSWEELEKASDKAYRKLVQKVDIQGFRRGRAPRSLLERKLGKESIYQEGLDDLMNEAYRGALKEHNIVPLTQPELDAPLFEIGQPYHFSLKVPILPSVELGDYHSLHFDRPEADVTSEEVEKEIEQRRERLVKWEEAERPAQIGDRVTMDLKLTAEEQLVSDLKENVFELTSERHGLFTGMDEQLVGLTVGESKTFSTTIPEEYANEKLAGKAANYEVTLHKVEFRELPELDDALAVQISNAEFQTLEDLRKSISDQLLASKKRKINENLREQALKALVDQASVTIHPVLIEEEAQEMMHQMGHILEQQQMSLEQYLLLVKQTKEEYLESFKPDAERRARQQLVLDAFIKQEEITVEAEEIEAIFQLYAQMGRKLQQTEAQIRSLANSLQHEKAIVRLVELTTDPDPDEVAVVEETSEEEVATSTEAEASETTTVTEVEVEELTASETTTVTEVEVEELTASEATASAEVEEAPIAEEEKVGE
jgi:trigger factor